MHHYHVVNQVAKILREKRHKLMRSDREWDYTEPQFDLLDEFTLEFAQWLESKGITPNEFIERSGYAPGNSDH